MKNGDDFEALLAQFEQEHAGATEAARINVGDRVQGKVVSVGETQVFVDLGGKSEGIMEIAALTDADGNLTAGVGDTVEATVTSIDEETGSLLLGAQQARHLHGLAELEQAYRQQLPVDGRVTGAIKGGVEVQIAGQRAFCPASQVDIRFIEDLSEFVGQHLSFRITKLEGGRRPNLVVSRRAILEEEQQALAAETRARIEEGAVLAGTVTSVKDYGAFVDLGGVEGMVHVSELAYGHVKHPSDVLREGQTVEVQVLRIEQTENPKRPEKIALSIRALARDPWQDATQRFPVGSQVRGTVTRLQPFGAFVEIEPGLEGLVHISELGAGRRVSHPQEVVNSGQAVEATVLGVDPDKRRISLSLDASKQASDAPQAASYVDYERPEKCFGTLGDLLRESMQQQKKK
jgi:small subunit ribosomal protein S1